MPRNAANRPTVDVEDRPELATDWRRRPKTYCINAIGGAIKAVSDNVKIGYDETGRIELY